MADRLILMVPDGADSLISILDLYMREWVSGAALVNIAALITYLHYYRFLRQVLAKKAIEKLACNNNTTSPPNNTSAAHPTPPLGLAALAWRWQGFRA